MTDNLELFAFEVNEKAFEEEEVHYMYFPDCWTNYLNRTKNHSFKLIFKLKPLKQRLRALFPNVIYMNLDLKAINQQKPWVVSTSKIDITKFFRMCLYWFADKLKTSLDKLDPDLVEAKMSWEKAKIKELKSSISVFEWLPGLYTHRFCQHEHQLNFLETGNKVQFYPLVFNGKNECMSEPIRQQEKHDYFSYVLRFQLVTRGTENKEVLSVKMGIRRFIQTPLKKGGKFLFQVGKSRSRNKKPSVLVSPRHNDSIISFSQLHIEYNRASEKATKWEEIYKNVFDDFFLGEKLESDDIFKDPLGYMFGEKNFKALIVYNDNHYQNDYCPKVNKGIGVPEKWGFFELVQSYFPELNPLTPSSKVKDPFRQNGRVLPLLITESVSRIVLEVWGDDYLFNKVKEHLISKEVEDQSIASQTSRPDVFLLNSNKEVKLELRHYDPEGYIQELDLHRYKNNKVKAHQDFVTKLVKKLNTKTSTEEHIMSLVQIDEDLKGKDHDPKKAIREGMARTGRITQFIHPLKGEKLDKNRIVNSLLDLLSDFGFLRNNWASFKIPEVLLSLSIQKFEEGFLPVLTKVENQKIQLKLFGNNDWLSPREALLTMPVHQHVLRNKFDHNINHCKEFLVSAIHEVLTTTDKTIYLTLDAARRYDFLKEITNNKLVLDEIPELDSTLKDEPRLKVIRLNTTEEVPQYRILNHKKPHANKKSGLFKDEVGIFYSVGMRPDSMGGPRIRNDMIKYETPKKQLMQQRVVEIIPTGNLDSHEREKIAYIIHVLRRMNLTFSKHTEQPFPVHKVKALAKYSKFNFGEYVNEFDDAILMKNEDYPVFS